MKNAILLLLLFFNIFFIISYLIGFDFITNSFWTRFFGFFFIISILVSCFIMVRSWRESVNQTYFSLAVLAVSIGAFGWYVFLNYLYLLFG